MKMKRPIIVLDFGSQYAQLIVRRLREARIYAEMYPWNASPQTLLTRRPWGFILSGGPASVYANQAPQIAPALLESGLPILGICYGMQALTHALGGRVAPAKAREYGLARLHAEIASPLLPAGDMQVWMSHGDRVEALPPGFVPLGRTENSPFAVMGDVQRRYYGVQFHPEVRHTPRGGELLRRFAVEVCGAPADWTPDAIIESAVQQIRAQVGKAPVLAAVSGGVDSTVAAALVHRAVGDQLTSVFVDTGLLRAGEPQQVETTFRQHLGARLVVVSAAERFFAALRGLTDPEEKRRRIGELFIRLFEEQAHQLGDPPFLVQGTIYPDVVESAAPDRKQAQKIKTHHNVGGLPDDMRFSLVEPLRYLFKDEVRAVGEALGLPAEMIWRQPFPGPGLAVRCLGEVTPERVARLRAADDIFIGALQAAGLLGKGGAVAQAYAALLPVRSVGVMGDQRTYQEPCVLRAVQTEDFMTADWARLPADLLAEVANRIVNQVEGINRVVYDITSKPPATIEWE